MNMDKLQGAELDAAVAKALFDLPVAVPEREGYRFYRLPLSDGGSVEVDARLNATTRRWDQNGVPLQKRLTEGDLMGLAAAFRARSLLTLDQSLTLP